VDVSYERFVQILAEELMADPEWVTPEALLVEELGLQSIDVVQVVDRLETELGCTLQGLDLGDVETVEQLYRQLMAAREEAGPSRHEVSASVMPPRRARLPHELALARYLPEDVCAGASTLLGVLERQVATAPEAPAIVFEGTTTTYRQLAHSVTQLAGALAEAGVERGDRVVIVMPNHPSFFAVYYGAQRLGAIAVPVFHASAPQRVAGIARQCGAAAIVTLRPLVRPIRRRLEAALGEAQPRILDVPALEAKPVQRGASRPEPAPDDLAMLQYTSGTTGDSKGVMLTHAALLANVRQMVVAGGMSPDEVVVSWLPVSHDMGLISMTMTLLYLGGKLVLLPVSPKPHVWLQAIQEHRATLTAAPDFAYRYALRFGGDLSRYDLSSLEYCLVAAEPVRARTIASFESAIGEYGVLKPGYGLAECSVAVAAWPRGRRYRIRTDAGGVVACGPPLPGIEVSIRDDRDHEVPCGTVGQICVTSPSQTTGYFRDARATEALFTADGRVRTGDLGKVDADGNLYVVARTREVIIVAGRNVAPKELEELVEGVDGVGAAMALGIDRGTDAGEQVHIVIESQCAASADLGEVSRLKHEVGLAVSRHLGLRPEAVHLVPQHGIPRTHNGKLRYREMRDRVLDKVG
jgi:acyl-CoA synthetase (AMP-forming)/AMP-acid ligase II/acyl carrier protein